MQEITNVISSLGYPIVMSLILLYMMDGNEKKYDETIEGLRKTIENNTITLTKLCEKLELAIMESMLIVEILLLKRLSQK